MELEALIIELADGTTVTYSQEIDKLGDAGPNEIGIFLVTHLDGRLLAAYSQMTWKSAEYQYADAA
uniref:Uncharacterized protein n=1 Tax=Micrococcus phage Kurnik TaxID=3092208 RepID=A0AAU6R710_9CAUD